MASSRAVNTAIVRCYQHSTAGPWQVVTLIADSKRRSLLMMGDDDVMFMTRSLNVTPKTTEQNLIVRSDKSVAYVTNNKRLRSTFCTIEANYWQTRSIARPLCDSRARPTCSFLEMPGLLFHGKNDLKQHIVRETRDNWREIITPPLRGTASSGMMLQPALTLVSFDCFL